MTNIMGKNYNLTQEEAKSVETFAYGLFGGAGVVILGAIIMVLGFLVIGFGVGLLGCAIVTWTFRKSDEDYKKLYGDKT